MLAWMRSAAASAKPISSTVEYPILFSSKYSHVRVSEPKLRHSRSSSQALFVVNQHFRIPRHLEALVRERHPETSPRALRKAAHYLTMQCAKAGWATGYQLVRAWDKVYRN